MGADHRSRPAARERLEFGEARPGERHVEDRAHGRAHRLDRERVDRVADQDHALGADRVGGAHDGAEIAGVAHRLERHPDVARPGPESLGRRQPLLEHAEHGLRVVAPAILASTASLTEITLPPRATRSRARAARPAARSATPCRMHQRADRPAGIERVGDELQPLGDEEPARLAVLARAPGRGCP